LMIMNKTKAETHDFDDDIEEQKQKRNYLWWCVKEQNRTEKKMTMTMLRFLKNSITETKMMMLLSFLKRSEQKFRWWRCWASSKTEHKWRWRGWRWWWASSKVD
jgi:hypothetical protein